MTLINFAFILKDILYLGVIVLLSYLFYKERQQLLNRIMARDFQEYEYHDKMYKTDIKETEKVRDTARKEQGEDAEIEEELDLEYKEEKKFMKGTDEDWAEDEVDLQELRKRIDKDK